MAASTPPIPPTPSPSPSFSYETSPHLYLFTSLTSGSSHIITATSRLETILKANRVPFKAVDCATDERARRIWSRRAGPKRRLPGLVREGEVLADLDEVEEWNETGELKERLVAGDRAAGGGDAMVGKENVRSQGFPFEAKQEAEDKGREGEEARPKSATRTQFKVAPDKSGEGAAGEAAKAVKSVED